MPRGVHPLEPGANTNPPLPAATHSPVGTCGGRWSATHNMHDISLIGRQLAVASLFKCSICEDLLAKPKTCGNCRVNFCTSCIADHLHEFNRCPKCCTEKPTIVDFPHKLRYEIGRIKLVCRAKSVTTEDSETGDFYG